MQHQKFYTYLFCTLFILFWWMIAFHQPVAYEPHTAYNFCEEEQYLHVHPDQQKSVHLLHIDRNSLRYALNGDFALMIELIMKWDIEAEIAATFSKEVKRLERKEIQEAHLLAKILLQESNSVIREKKRLKLLTDYVHTPIDLSEPPELFLPQTYLAAGVLLAIREPETLVALPRGMREQKEIYSEKITSSIKEDVDALHLEKLYTYQPDIAITSEKYTHPLVTQGLKNLSIPTFQIGEIKTFEEIESLIRTLGHLSNRPIKGELLALFVKAAALAIDNKRALLVQKDCLEKVLVVNYHTRYSLPGTNTLTRYMLDRMQIKTPKGLPMEGKWSIPLTEEMIIHINPEQLIIITESSGVNDTDYFYHSQIFQHIDAVKLRNISFLDEAIQQTLSQHALLAYYDLNKALLKRYE